ncbi:MAG: rRNA methyltransferase [Chitinophagales bacterium]|nr:MAG: rRNA methyltransferase [Chitinophagales bacterium]
MVIHSEKNQRIQQLVRLREKARERKKLQVFTIEGVREISLAIQGGYTLREVYHCPAITSAGKSRLLDMVQGAAVFEVSKKVYEKLAMRESTEGIIAVAAAKLTPLKQLSFAAEPLLLVVEEIEKPGNLGALLRTADATGADAVIACGDADWYNPQTIRASLGTVFTNRIVSADTLEIKKWLHEKHITTYAASPSGDCLYTRADYTKPCAIVLGSEARGLSAAWLDNVHHKIVIPMKGIIDSLNVSAAAAVLLYEALRQRSAA